MTELSFEHFDPEIELCNLDIHGRPIKPRRKPGRKPNPPSPAQRKAQNRAAQRAFRERKRQEMHNAETNIKKCIHMRDLAIKQVKQLEQKVDELLYENNFLKGQVLTLKIACMANRVDVPKFWDTGIRDKMGSDITTSSRTREFPQPLEFFLDNKKFIITMNVNDLAAYTPPPSDAPISPDLSTDQQMPTQVVNDNSFLLDSLLSPPPDQQSPLAGLLQMDDISNLIQAASTADIDPMLIDYLMQPNTMNEIMSVIKDVPPELWLTLIPPQLVTLIPLEIRSFITTVQEESIQKQHQQQEVISTPSTTTTQYDTTFKPAMPVEDDFWTDIKDPVSPSAANKVYVAGPILPLDAVNQMRAIRDQNDSQYLLKPTELQRRIPHDPRIDLIPGPTMRDYMIIFQDFYDANELFNFLIESAMFIGGELGNPDCWFVPPSFISKYWFLCPNYKPTRPDNSVEFAVFLAQRMLNRLKRRKELYIMRDLNPDLFPSPNMVKEEITDYQGDEEKDKAQTEKNDASIDILVIETINQKAIPRIKSPNVFTV
ncbi:uncharacterized protein B0P05DRAFT_594484 [Gilbertella persicaria]|uniref:uncharacterized protein n=1 Tax=Gilbertella persicaria TaxID=101096 RepID=UPI00221EA75C|nr:uncharacterized protein B0P05DRAFT_594484 [Gilbertella persicaria]KAI8090133.1 hypothetical protein B0P05DRAFT_594484 [Gilbertella persicaria]